MKEKALMLLLGLGLLAAYISNASFAYFSDTETVTVAIQAGEWGRGVDIIYPCPHLFLVCHPIFDFGDSSHGPNFTVRKDLTTGDTLKNLENSSRVYLTPSIYKSGPDYIEHSDPPSKNSSIQCHHHVECVGYLEGIWIHPESNTTLEKVRVFWTGGGSLRTFWIGSYKVGNLGQESPAEFSVGKELKADRLYPVTFKFRNIKPLQSYKFTITFFFSNNYSRTICFTIGDGD